MFLCGYRSPLLHHKIMVVDRLWVTVGTTNFDDRSFAHNEESNICCAEPVLAEQFHKTFLQDLDACERVTRDSWERRGIWARSQEWVAAFLQEQS